MHEFNVTIHKFYFYWQIIAVQCWSLAHSCKSCPLAHYPNSIFSFLLTFFFFLASTLSSAYCVHNSIIGSQSIFHHDICQIYSCQHNFNSILLRNVWKLQRKCLKTRANKDNIKRTKKSICKSWWINIKDKYKCFSWMQVMHIIKQMYNDQLLKAGDVRRKPLCINQWLRNRLLHILNWENAQYIVYWKKVNGSLIDKCTPLRPTFKCLYVLPKHQTLHIQVGYFLS